MDHMRVGFYTQPQPVVSGGPRSRGRGAGTTAGRLREGLLWQWVGSGSSVRVNLAFGGALGSHPIGGVGVECQSKLTLHAALADANSVECCYRVFYRAANVFPFVYGEN